MKTILESLEARRLLTVNLLADFGGIYPTDSVRAVDGITWYFGADDGAHGKELWKSDGTQSGTQLVADVETGADGSNPANFLRIGATAVFTTHRADGTLIGLWRTDGTAAGAVQLASFGPDAFTRRLVDLGSTIVLPSYDLGTGSLDVWVTDGTADGTSMIKNLGTIPGNAVPFPVPLVNGRLILQSAGRIFSTDGTAAGTFELGDPTGADATRPKFARIPSGRFSVAYFFGERNDGDPIEVWSTDGTVAGTRLVATPTVAAAPDAFTPVGDETGVVFQLSSGDQFAEHTLWYTDGTPSGTAAIHTDSAGFDQSINLNTQKTLLLRHDAQGQYALWVTDGTQAGTIALKDLMAGTLSAPPVVIDSNAFFIMSDADDVNSPARLTQLWRSDGTAAGTMLVQDLTSSTIEWTSTTLQNIDGRLVIDADPAPVIVDPSTFAAAVGPTQARFLLDAGRVLRIYGTLNDDNIRIYQVENNANRFVVNLNGEKRSFAFSEVRKILVYGFSGDDSVAYVEKNGLLTIRSMIFAGAGNDTIHGDSTRDTVFGDSGDDLIKTGRSADSVDGGTGDDTIFGSTGDDTLNGNGGSDELVGNRDRDLIAGGSDGSTDHLEGSEGEDVIFGSAVLELFYNGQPSTGDPLDETLLG